MSVRVDTSSLIAGACVVGNRGLGITGAVIRATTATGTHGPGYLYNDWSSGDDAKEFRGLIVTPPSGGTFKSYEDGSFDLTGAVDGTYGFTYRLFVDGADLGVATSSIVVGSLVGPDITAPTLTGVLAVSSLSPTGYTVTWSPGFDNVAVATYERSLDGGATWFDVGYVLVSNITGRTPGTTDQVRVRAKDAAGNVSTPPLSVSVTLPSFADISPPTLTGSITNSTPTNTSYALYWPIATDNVAVIGYEYSLDDGASYTSAGLSTSVSISGRAPGSTDNVRVRAYDFAGNRSVALSKSVTLGNVFSTEPVSVPDAIFAARLDSGDAGMESLVASLITAAREQAEHVTGRLYVPRNIQVTSIDWPSSTAVLYVQNPRNVNVSYWNGIAWVDMLTTEFAWAAVTGGTIIAPALGTTWPTLGDIAIGPRVRVDIAAGLADPLSAPEQVKNYIKALVTVWVRSPGASDYRKLEQNPHFDRLLDAERLWL